MSRLIVILGDVHVPIHNKRATSSIFTMLADKPEIAEVIQVGDLIDMEAVARWSTGTRDEDGRKLQHEVVETRSWCSEWHAAFPGRKVFFRGNHDDRMEKYCRTKAQGLFGLEDLELPSLLRFKDNNITEVRQPYQAGPNTYGIHGVKLGKRSGMSIRREMEAHAGVNLFMGHCHRQGLVWETSWAGGRHKRVWGMEVGHMADRTRMDYLGHGQVADWQTGFAVLWVNGSEVVPELVPVSDYGIFHFDGKRYT